MDEELKSSETWTETTKLMVVVPNIYKETVQKSYKQFLKQKIIMQKTADCKQKSAVFL